MKIIFLDIDGVLNSTRSLIANGGYGSIFDHDSWKELDPVAVKLISHVAKETGSDIVLSSSWRILANKKDIIAFQDFLGVSIIDVTPQSKDDTRGEEIKQWLENCKEDIDAFCIVDDDSDMLPEQEGNFVQTDERIGLTWQNCEDIMLVLNN